MIKISAPIFYYKMIKNDIEIHLFADKHEGNYINSCLDIYNHEDYTISDFLYKLYKIEKNNVFLLEGSPDINSKSDEFIDYLTDSVLKFRNLKLNNKSTNEIYLTDLRECVKFKGFNMIIPLIDFAIKNNNSNYISSSAIFSNYIKYFNNINPIIKKHINIKKLEIKWKNIEGKINILKELYKKFKEDYRNNIISTEINKIFKDISSSLVDYPTINIILKSNKKKFILYYGWRHIDNMIEILKDFGFETRLNTKYNENNRCLELDTKFITNKIIKGGKKKIKKIKKGGSNKNLNTLLNKLDKLNKSKYNLPKYPNRPKDLWSGL